MRAILALCAFCIAQPAAALTQQDAARMIAEFDQRCVVPLESGHPPVTSGLRAPTGENAKAFHADLTADDILMMSEFKRAGLYTCIMQHSVITSPIAPQDYPQIEAAIAAWLDAKIETGAFLEDTSCPQNPPYWDRTLLGQTEGRPQVYIGIRVSASKDYSNAALSISEVYGLPEPICSKETK